MRTVAFELDGRTWHLLMNGAAYYDILEKYGTEADSILDHIRPNDKAGLEATCWFLAKLAEQGELWRRYQGLENGPFLAAQRARAVMMLADVERAKLAIAEAVALGFARETKDPEPEYVDKTLHALKKKEGAAAPAAPSICRRLLNFLASLFRRLFCSRSA